MMVELVGMSVHARGQLLIPSMHAAYAHEVQAMTRTGCDRLLVRVSLVSASSYVRPDLPVAAHVHMRCRYSSRHLM